MPIRATVWGENVHEQKNKAVADNYPEGMHGQIAKLAQRGQEHQRHDRDAAGSRARDDREEARRDRRAASGGATRRTARSTTRSSSASPQRVWEGMGLIVLHSGHSLEDLQAADGHALRTCTGARPASASGSGSSTPAIRSPRACREYFELENEEMYGEPFTVPEPLETVFISWFQGGEVFRSGLTYRRGAGNIFYFRPGHETYPTYHDATVGKVLRNAVNWAFNAERARRADRRRRTGRSRRRSSRSSSAAPSCTKHRASEGRLTDRERTTMRLLDPRHRRHGRTTMPSTSRAIDGVTLVGGVDVDPNAARRLQREARHRATASPRSMRRSPGASSTRSTNVTPDSIHHPTTMAALAAGKHVFCEKPLATDYAKALEMTEAAETAGLINMVNLTYRNVAELQKARELVPPATIGTVKHIEARYLQSWLVGTRLGRSGASRARGCGGSARGTAPTACSATSASTSSISRPSRAGTDIASMICRLQTFDKVAGRQDRRVRPRRQRQLHHQRRVRQRRASARSTPRAGRRGHINDLRLRLYGEKGGLELQPRPLGLAAPHLHRRRYRRRAPGRRSRPSRCQTNYQRFAEAVRTGVQTEPSFRHAAKLQQVLDLALVADLDRKRA